MSVRNVKTRRNEAAVKTVLLETPEDVTPESIKAFRERYNLSWHDLHNLADYSWRARSINHAVNQPERFLTPKLKRQFLQGVQKYLRQRGDVCFVTYNENVEPLHKNIRIAHNWQICKGHQEYCSWVSDAGYCGEECKEKYKERKK